MSIATDSVGRDLAASVQRDISARRSRGISVGASSA